MAEFRITRSFVQELCHDGASQARGCEPFAESGSFPLEIFTTPATSGSSRTYGYSQRPADLITLTNMAEAIAVMANHLRGGDFKVDLRCGTLGVREQDRSGIACGPAKYSIDDFRTCGTFANAMVTVIIDQVEDGSKKVVTAGRGPDPDLTNLRTFHLKNGPVFIAGFGLGNNIQPLLPHSGDTHHQVYGSQAGDLAVLDCLIVPS